MADFGMAPYAWLKNEGGGGLGMCLADSVCGFPIEYRVDEEAEHDLAEWATDFEKFSQSPEFDWAEWNDRGITLASDLFFSLKERGFDYLVEYHQPHDDPSYPSVGIIAFGDPVAA